jgi:ELWxxDGT repeat protein
MSGLRLTLRGVLSVRRRPWSVVAGLLLAMPLLVAGRPALADTPAPGLVADIAPGSASSNPASLLSAGGALLFAAEAPGQGVELWRSSGSGATLVRDIFPGPTGSGPGDLVRVGSTVFFAATAPGLGRELWKTDGTEAGTVLVKEVHAGADGIPTLGEPLLVGVGTTLFFIGNDGTNGVELWKSDGTADGTVLVRDIFPGASGSQPRELTNVGGRLFFTANDPGTGGRELWVSDGTTGGTARVRDVLPGPDGSSPLELTAVGNLLFFRADDGTRGNELWRSDGTEDGTVRVRDINPGAVSSDPSRLVNVGGTLFFRANDGVVGIELWKSDGTEAGTVLVSDIRPGLNASRPDHLANVGGLLYFAATTSIGTELWSSDGTEAGTVLVKDINPAAGGSSDPQQITDGNGVVYFVADDGVSGFELWVSDGTAAGTVLVGDINPGVADAGIRALTQVGDRLFFAADNGTLGLEPWALLGTPAQPVLAAIPGPVVVGGVNVLRGVNFTAGTVVKLFVATAAGSVGHGPFVPASWSPTELTVAIPATVRLGNGFASVQVVNTDVGFPESNVVGVLLAGDAEDNIPTILAVNLTPLAPPDLAIGVAHADLVLAKGSTVTLNGTGFNAPLVNLFTAAGNLGPLTPLPGGTDTQIQVVVPTAAPVGPGSFQVVNNPFSGNVQSNAVSTVIGAALSVASVSSAGSLVTVTGTGFSVLSVINLFNDQGGGVVNLGGIGAGGPRVPLTVSSDTTFSFTIPAGAVPGAAYVQVLNPPFIPFSSTGTDPDGAFTITLPVPLTGPAAPVPDVRADAADVEGSTTSGTNPEGEAVMWTGLSAASVDSGGTLRGAGEAPWRSSAWATRAIGARGSVSWTVAGEGDLVVGLGARGGAAGLAGLIAGFSVSGSARDLAVVEDGTRVASLGPAPGGARLRIAVDAVQITYWLGDRMLWSSSRPAAETLVVRASFGIGRAAVAGARLTGALGSVVDWAAAAGVLRQGTVAAGAGPRAVLVKGPRVVPGASVEAAIGIGAGIGFGRPGGGTCDTCLVADGDRVRLWHRGVSRGWQPAGEAGTRYRVELGLDGLVRYWAGERLLDAVPDVPGRLVVRGVLGGPAAFIDTAVVGDHR